jgi:single-strand DNA-binding protein
MARGVNKVILIGNLGADPDTRYSAGGNPVCTLSLATTDSWTDKQTGQKQERTEWHRIKVFGKVAEICQEYLRKGRQIYIEGSLRTDKYTGKDGIERYTTDIIARNMQMLGGGGEGSGGGGGGGYSRAPAPQRAPGPAASQPAPGSAPQPAPSTADDGGFEDDDIPF